MSKLSELPAAQQEILLLSESLRRRRTNKIDWYYPDTGPLRRELYPKSLEFFAAGATHTERMVMAANRVGKTEGMGGLELSYHLTGEYPHWWVGKRFKRPVRAWAAGDTSVTVRDILQLKLLGPWLSFGTGLIRADNIVRYTPKRNVAESVDQVVVRHKSGGLSYLTFKSYDQGRESFQGTEQDIVWLDEEPPSDIYSECLTRTMTVGGMIMSTFTPLRGMGDVILGFIDKDCPAHKYKLNVTWDDVPHLTKKMKDELWASFPPSERDARAKGIPTIGSGRIYPVIMDDMLVDDFVVPPYWRKAFGFDVGWKKTAVLWGAHDSESDILYCYSEHYQGQAEPAIHASAIKARGIWIPGAIDPAANGRSQQTGEQLMEVYRAEGLDLTNANNALDAGILQTWNRLSTGRIKFLRKATPNLQQEFPLYHRDEKGQVVKRMNHLMDCLRYLVMTGIELAKYPPAGTRARARKGNWRTA
jgi:phage terminase large subunit-like protein